MDSHIQRLQITLTAILAVASVIGVAFAIAKRGDRAGREARSAAPIPARRITDLATAARAAGCVVRHFPEEGHAHTTKAVRYRTNPPTSGDHYPPPGWSPDGVYDPGTEQAKEHWVHSLEHGRVITMYGPGTTRHHIAQLETLYAETLKGDSGYHQLLQTNNTNMPYAVAAVTWRRYLGCTTFNPRIFDAIRAYREKHIDQGREFIP